MMDLPDFYKLVKRMRDVQKEYFKVRSKSSLKRSIALEHEVDVEIKAYERKDAPKQGVLFNK